jgi:hypothetical protein
LADQVMMRVAIGTDKVYVCKPKIDYYRSKVGSVFVAPVGIACLASFEFKKENYFFIGAGGVCADMSKPHEPTLLASPSSVMSSNSRKCRVSMLLGLTCLHCDCVSLVGHWVCSIGFLYQAPAGLLLLNNANMHIGDE